MADSLKVLFLSPEVVPFAKTGGLADVAGSLPPALSALGAEVSLVLPLYRIVKEGNYFHLSGHVQAVEVSLGATSLSASVYETRLDDTIPVYLIKQEDLYDRPFLYGDTEGDYVDNLERFTFFAHAALRIAERLPYKPDVIHCHDWQTGLVPALLKSPSYAGSILTGTPVVFTIHNLGYPGLFPPESLPVTGLPAAQFFTMDGLEYWGRISLLKAGIVYADAITTVSPTYAREIQTPEHGMGLDGILRRRTTSLHGVLNGVNYRTWDPEIDPHLSANYSLQKPVGKVRCKESLIDEMGLDDFLKRRPVLGMISRLDRQKGLDLLIEVIDSIIELNVGLVILGAGDTLVQEALQDAAIRHSGHIGLKVGFDEPLAHRIMAGSDLLLVPSRYEPCGLTQMYALKYGTVPVVRATGGLEDTIAAVDPNTGNGTGFKFIPYEAKAFLASIREAVGLFGHTERWEKIIANGMKQDYSWERSARQYLELYRSVLGHHDRADDAATPQTP